MGLMVSKRRTYTRFKALQHRQQTSSMALKYCTEFETPNLILQDKPLFSSPLHQIPFPQAQTPEILRSDCDSNCGMGLLMQTKLICGSGGCLSWDSNAISGAEIGAGVGSLRWIRAG
ncbi:hypothetical protein M758_5G035900 [Ceratodon purpureus]|nr:hypothetical protein M758_5G035900 [Ceratodon purpureus]